MMFLLLATGCSSPTGTVTGKLTYRNKTVVLGTVSLHCEKNNKQFSAELDPDGRFTFENVPVGPVTVCVVSLNPSQPKSGKGHTIKPTGDPAKWFKVPAKYMVPQDSDLKIEVQPDMNEVALTLKD